MHKPHHQTTTTEHIFIISKIPCYLFIIQLVCMAFDFAYENLLVGRFFDQYRNYF